MILRTLYRIIPGTLAGAVVAGCASTGQQAALPGDLTEMRAPVAQSTAAGEAHHGASESQGDTPTEPTGTIHLRQALALALLQNPELAALSHDSRAAEARALQARLLPNPELEWEIGEYDRGGMGIDSSETAVVLSQSFELGGKRRWRTRVAEAEGKLAAWDYETERLDVLTSTVRRFTAVLAAQRRLDLAESTVELAAKTAQAVADRVNAGKETALQASKATTELEMVRIGLLEARSDLAITRKRLAAMWGSEQPSFRNAAGDLDDVLEKIPPLTLFRSRLSANPNIARWEDELQLRAAALASEKASRIPDLTASVGIERFEEDSTDSMAFGIGVPLPLFDRNQGNIAAARHDLARVKAEQKGAQTTLAFELAEAHASLTSAHSKVTTLRSRVVPTMKEAFEAAHEGYKQGKFGFLDVLDAQRGVFDSEGALVDALSDYHAAVAAVQRITGTSIKELTHLKEEISK